MFQTSINAPRQKTQAIIKQAAAKAGIEIELKSVTGSVFFSSDTANPDNVPAFLRGHGDVRDQHDPGRSLDLAAPVRLWEAATKENKWQGATSRAGATPEYDAAYNAAQSELDPVKARRPADQGQRPRGLERTSAADPPAEVSGAAAKLVAPRSGWDNDLSFRPNGAGRPERETRTMGAYILRRLLIAIRACRDQPDPVRRLALAPGDPFGELAANPNVPRRCARPCG